MVHSAAQSAVPAASAQSPWKWFADLLVQELSPFPGRGWTVARMTIAATFMMLWIMVFRIPGAALGAYYTLLFSRDSEVATLRSVVRAVGAVGASLLYIVCTVRLFTGDPLGHFLWVAGTLFIIFFLISSLTEYLEGTAFGFLAVTSITNWDYPANTGVLFENTLWTGCAVVVAAMVTVAVEVVARNIHHSDEFSDRLLARIQVVENCLASMARQQPIDEKLQRRLDQYAMIGTASLRQLLLRSRKGSHYVAQMSGTVALIGRLIDLTINVSSMPALFREQDSQALADAADRLHRIRIALRNNDLQAVAELRTEPRPTRDGSFIADVEKTVGRIPEVFAGLRPLSAYLPSDIDTDQPARLFKPDTFNSTVHIRFALKGTLAALSCYVIYNSIQWHGLSSSVATCMITALSTVGSSRQKQLLRVAGAIMGGAVLGMLSQIFLLPHMDSIAEFTLLFAAVTGLAAWTTTSSPRISFAGAQTAFAFYITHLGTFGPQVSLVVARDNVLGILFGLLAMWLTFDRIWVKDSASDLIDSFVSNLRRIAGFDQPVRGDLRATIAWVRQERAAINSSFDQIRNISNSLIFEFGSGWHAKKALREQIRQWQPHLRTYFLLTVALFHYRAESSDGTLEPDAERNVRNSRQILLSLAELKDPAAPPPQVRDAARQTDALIQRCEPEVTAGRSENEPLESETMRVSRSMLDIAVSLAEEMREPA